MLLIFKWKAWQRSDTRPKSNGYLSVTPVFAKINLTLIFASKALILMNLSLSIMNYENLWAPTSFWLGPSLRLFEFDPRNSD